MARGWTYAFDRAFMWRVGSNGIATGQLDPNNLGTAPLTSHALDVRGPISATLSAPTYTRYEARGGGTYDGSATGGVETMGRLELTLDQEDPALYQLARGGLQDETTIVGANIYSDNTLLPAPFECGLMLVWRKQTLGSVKSTLYKHMIYPIGTASFTKPNPTQEGGMNTQTLVLGYDPQISGYFPWGEAFGEDQNWYNYNEISFFVESVYPYALTYFLADGVATSFISAFKPALPTVTAGRAGNLTSKNGTPTAAASIVPATGVFTIAAGATGDDWIAFYPTQNYLPVV